MATYTEITDPQSITRQFKLQFNDREFNVAVTGISYEYMAGDIEPTPAPMTSLKNLDLGMMLNALATAAFAEPFKDRLR